jgi:hypothetical protein
LEDSSKDTLNLRFNRAELLVKRLFVLVNKSLVDTGDGLRPSGVNEFSTQQSKDGFLCDSVEDGTCCMVLNSDSSEGERDLEHKISARGSDLELCSQSG